MKIFSKHEAVVLIIIFSFIGVISYFNFKVALRRGRDNERVNDINNIAEIVEAYHSKYNVYPMDLNSLSGVPKDPSTPQGYSYLYLSDGKFFQVFASFEGGPDESEYNAKIAARHLMCGKFICNYGKASGDVPLDKSIEEYENELYAKSKVKK